MAILKALVLAVASFTASSFGAPVVDKVSPPHITSSTTDPYGEPQITPFVPFIPGPGHWTTEFTVRGVAFTFGTTPPAWATVLGSGEPDRPTWEPAAWRPAPGVVPHNHAGGENIGPIAKRIVESAAPWNCSHAHPDCCPTEQDHNPCGIWGGVWKRDAGADKDGNPKGLWNGKEKRDEDTGCNTFGCPGWPLSDVGDRPTTPWKTITPEAKNDVPPVTITTDAPEVTSTTDAHEDPMTCLHFGCPGWPLSEVGDHPTTSWKTIAPEARYGASTSVREPMRFSVLPIESNMALTDLLTPFTSTHVARLAEPQATPGPAE